MKTQPLVRFMDTNGDGTGTKNAIGNYSGAGAEDFFIAPPADEDYLITSVKCHLADAAIIQDEYGGLGAALTNGLVFSATLDGVTASLDDGNPVKSNGEFGHFTYDFKRESWATTPTIQTLHVRWQFSDYFVDGDAPAGLNRGILLQGHRGDKLTVALNDDFSGLVDQHFVVFGMILLDWISARNAG